MNNERWSTFWLVFGLCLLITGCGDSSTTVAIAHTSTYVLTVNSTGAAGGVATVVFPADNNSATNGSTSFTRTYNAGTSVTLTAPATWGSNSLVSWSGCTMSSATTCTVALNTDTTVTENYGVPSSTPGTYLLTVNSTNPASGVVIGVTPSDNDNATNGSTSFTRTYNAGTSVTLTAPATSGSNSFLSWSGCTTSTAVTCTVVLAVDTTVTANYAVPPSTPETYILTVNSTNPASGVDIGVSPADNNHATTGNTSFPLIYNAGTSVTLTAPAVVNGGLLIGWSGCTVSSTTTCTVTLNTNTSVTANYAIPPPAPGTYTLTVNSTKPDSGVGIGVSPADNNNATNGSTSFTRNYNAGASVTLTAPAVANGDPLIGWSGCTASTTVTCTVTLNSNTTVTANYIIPPPTPATHVLTVNSTNPAGGVAIGVTPEDNNNATAGTTSFGRTYYNGTSITLTAPSTSGGNVFSSWTGCSRFSATLCTVTLNSDVTVTANYMAPAPTAYVLTVNSTNPANGVLIGAMPQDNKGVANGMTGFTRTYNAGTSVTLQAPPTSDSNTFSSWQGCTTSTAGTCIVVINSNTTVTANYAGATQSTYKLTVNSTNPDSGVAVGVMPGDNNGATNGVSSFTRTYNSGISVTLTAPSTSGSYSFNAWTGCTANATVTCNVTMTGNQTVIANYNEPSITSVSIMPDPASVVIGSTQQFTATVNGTGSYSSNVTWYLAAPGGSTLSPGTLSSSGLYTTPYPAPATVTITATSTQDPAKSGSVTVSLVAPATSTGPALAVDFTDQTRAISPYIYGMNAYLLDFPSFKTANIPITRWGGDATSRYNYKLDVTNTAQDYYFENRTGPTADAQPAVNGVSAFDALVDSNKAIGAATLGTVPVLGWIAKDGTSCSFPVSVYPDQYSVDPYNPCGDGETYDQVNITGVSPAVTSVAEGPAWAGQWVAALVNTFGTAANGGVGFYELDNEPSWWDDNHRDVHPLPSTYDEVTNNGIATAAAIKAADPTAEVNGPVIDYWWNFFYSKKDIEAGWSTGPCYSPWDSPSDREAHGGVPFIEYYLQQFAAYQAANNVRLLDYLDLHSYLAPDYPAGSGNSVGLTTAGDTGEQEVRINSTRSLWDPTYTDPSFPQPNYPTDPGYTTDNCVDVLQAPQIIPLMQSWIAHSYPGTKTAISEYNWGGLESINGAVTQADVLGIFGSYGLDMATLWQPPNPVTQVPGLMAYELYRNYDGNDSTFGNEALASTSTNQAQLSVYGALRTADNTITVMVINKTYGDLTSTLSIAHFTAAAGETAQAFLYSNANLAAIVGPSSVPITQPAAGSTSSTITTTFPAQSITLLVVPAN